MKLTTDFLNDQNTIVFADSDLVKRREFFDTLSDIASQDLSLAHSVFKTNAAKLIVYLAQRTVTDQLGAFSVCKPFDTVEFSEGMLNGKKHWVSNLEQATYGIFQVKCDNNIQLCYVNLVNSPGLGRDFNFLRAPGLADTCTGDVTFNNHPVDILFAKTDPRYFVSNNFNSLCFIVNYIGATQGLLNNIEYKNSANFRATLKTLKTALQQEIDHASFTLQSSDSFWHTRNSLYLSVKELLVSVCQYIIFHEAGNFYNQNATQGRHFYDCLVYSGHNGPVSRNLTTMYTESQDL